jgi:hypothetical protein
MMERLLNFRKPLVLLLALFCIQAALASDWKPIDPALLSKTAPSVEKDADVEGIFWEVRVNGSELSHYLRLKVFNERGIEIAKQVDLAYPDSVRIKDIEGRTIRPDGSIVELAKDAVFERTLASTRSYKVMIKSFAMPAVEPGVIVEYQYKEIRPLSAYSKYYLQSYIPMQTVSYHIKPSSMINRSAMNCITFNMPSVQLQKESGGFYGLQITNVPAFKNEPQMPPEDSIRAFVLVIYRPYAQSDATRYWNEYSKINYDGTKIRIKPNDEVRAKTQEIIGNSTQPDEVIEKLFRFVRSNIKNLNREISGMTTEQREKIKENKHASDTLKRGIGTSGDINDLLGSMAMAAGLDVRMAVTGDRSDFFFTPVNADIYFLRNGNVAIRVGTEWKYYDPSARYLPLGMLPWIEEGNSAIIPDPDKALFVTLPLSPPEKSQEKRKANLKLSEDGTLEGDAVIEYTGHLAAFKKESNAADSPAKREENLREMLKQRIGNADISQILIENVTDPDKPFTYRFHVRIADYAQRTGKRLFLNPEFFQKGIPPKFTASQRKQNIYFDYPWSEIDEVGISLPAGFDFDGAGGRQPISAGDAGKYQLEIAVSADHRSLRCVRSFVFGSNNNILFTVKNYPILRQFFDAVHETDNHVLTLQQTTAR